MSPARPASYGLGGLLGSCLGVAVSDCYATGTVSGFRMLGGFAGRVQAGTSIVHCHAVGRVLRGAGPWGRGGFAGRIDSPTDVRVTGCFWDVEASQASASAAGTGLTTVQMQDVRIFQAAGWDMAGDRTGWHGRPVARAARGPASGAGGPLGFVPAAHAEGDRDFVRSLPDRDRRGPWRDGRDIAGPRGTGWLPISTCPASRGRRPPWRLLRESSTAMGIGSGT